MTTPDTNNTLDQRIDATVLRSYRQARPGFSLIELTAVLVIIGLLMAGAAIAVPGYLSRARTRVTKTSMTTIKTAINTYMADNAGTPPESISTLIPNYIEPGTELDAWDQPFVYRAPGQSQAFDLISSGPDKEIQTSDDINIWTMDVNSAD
ncbi:MAG: type II secretion system protein GspG [bacterium]|nr:type II secretion system protein GspG [bacterium]